MRTLPILLVLPLLTAAANPEACEGWRENGVHIPPIPIVDVARDPIPIVDHGTVAHEVAQIATEGWQLAGELRIPGPERLVYPAGTPLEPDYMGRSAALCLPVARPPFTSATDAAERRWRGDYVEACLVDADGDGLHERANIFAGNSTMHVPTRRLARSEALARPQQLAADPLGLAASRRYVHRQVTAYVDGPVVEGARVRLRIAHAFQDQDLYPRVEGSYAAGPDGTHVYRPAPPLPYPVSMTGYNYRAAERDTETAFIITAVPEGVDGLRVAVGGLEFRIDHYSHGWTLQPLAYRFPPWISYGCNGRSIVLGFKPPGK